MTCGRWSRGFARPNGKIDAERWPFGGLLRDREKKKRNEPNLSQPTLNPMDYDWFPVRRGPRVSDISPFASPEGEEAPTREQVGPPGHSNRATANRAGSEEPSSQTMRAKKRTKRTQFPITTIKSGNLHCWGGTHGASDFAAQNASTARGGHGHQFRASKESTTYGRVRRGNWLTVPSRHAVSPFCAGK